MTLSNSTTTPYFDKVKNKLYFKKRKEPEEKMFAWLKKVHLPFTKSTVALAYENLEKGKEIFYTILEAIEQNPVHSKEHGETGAMFANCEPSRNGDHNSFCVFLPGNHLVSGQRYARKYFVLQFDIDVFREGEEIQILFDRHGSAMKFALLEFELALAMACAHIRSWRLDEQEPKA